MLIVRRKIGERIRLTFPDGRSMVITVEGLGSINVALSFDGPRDIVVTRMELENRKEVDGGEIPARLRVP